MRQQVKKILFLVVCVLVLGAGCQKEVSIPENGMQIYFFDCSKNELVAELLPESFKSCETNQEKVKFIIGLLKENKSVLLSAMQLGTPMPIDGDTTSINANEKIVKINFTSEYNDLSAQEKIGMRASIVYSLTQLDFINGVDFYVNQVPLAMATGKTVGPINTDMIKKSAFNPSPATQYFILNVYFANAEGKLEKEVHRFPASRSSKEDKLVIEELIQGPQSSERFATVPNDLKVNTVETLNGVCQVDLSFDPKSKFFEDDETRTLMIYSIVNSLTELSQVKKVIISIDGQEEISFTSEIDLPNTFERNERYINQENSMDSAS